MPKLSVLIFSLFILVGSVFAQPTIESGNSPLEIASGATVFFPYKINMPNNSVIDNGDGTITLNLISGTQASGYVVNPMTNLGDLIYGGSGGTPTRLGIGGANTLLHGGATPSWSNVVEGDISLSNVNTNNATSTRHGFLTTLSNDSSQFLNGLGNFSTPAGVANAYVSQAFNNVATATVVHNFGAKPVVNVIDSLGNVFIPKTINHDTNNSFSVQFSVATSGTVLASVGTPQPQNLTTVNSNYTLVASDYIVRLTTAGLTATLPQATGNVGRVYVIDNNTTGTASVVAVGGVLIEGQTSQALPSDSAMAVYCTGSAYRIF